MNHAIFNPSNYYFNATEEFDLQDLKLLKKTSGVWNGKDWISASAGMTNSLTTCCLREVFLACINRKNRIRL
ncbi:MAG: hypothetical protein HY034_03570 [Nitrospirae bacterium]|nr:hypothetical protein [Nitrospirota bacterium]